MKLTNEQVIQIRLEDRIDQMPFMARERLKKLQKMTEKSEHAHYLEAADAALREARFQLSRFTALDGAISLEEFLNDDEKPTQ